MPVALPPGRARLATNPCATGSPLTPKAIGIVVVAALAAQRRRIARRSDYGHATTDQIGHERRQTIVLTAEPVVLDDDVLTLHVAHFAEASTKRGCRAYEIK
jgi:hypothetical protein